MPKKREGEYAYCALTQDKFLIMKRDASTSATWHKYVEAAHESAAKYLVQMLNGEVATNSL